MVSVRSDPEPDEFSEFESVSRWREEQLLDAGYDSYHAYVLSRLHDVDLHRACELRLNGATEDQAISILL